MVISVRVPESGVILRYIAFIQFQFSTIIQNLSIPQIRGKLVTFLFQFSIKVYIIFYGIEEEAYSSPEFEILSLQSSTGGDSYN